MDILFLGIIIFLFVLAVFDLSVGVSNDAVNFLNSAIGAKAAKFKTIIIIASVGVFAGAAMSNGMMDIARHGIFRPEHFSFYDLICIFMAVIVTDIILLDIFNSLGMPTSTTVSMVFELLGAAFVIALIKMWGDDSALSLMDQSQSMPQILFSWHGGETLMRPLSFYKKVIELQKKYGGGLVIDNSIQTNGTLLTDEWCRFFKDNNWLVGVSVDGPQEFHDEYRRNNIGAPSFHKVMRGINLLKKHGVEWNALAVVNDFNADYPLDFYHFFKEIECRYIQFTPIVERIIPHTDGRTLASPMDAHDAPLADFSVSPAQWGEFLCTIFDEWVKNDVGQYFIQLFDSTLANWAGVQPGVCTMARTCGHAGVMEFNGDVYSCDHFVFPEYKLGNIREKTLVEMMYSDRQQKFGTDKYD